METDTEKEETFAEPLMSDQQGSARKRGRSGAAEGDASTARKRGRKRHDDAAGDAEKAAITGREPSPGKTPFHGFIS